MIWNTLPFSEAHASLVAAASRDDLASVEAILEPIKTDLQQLLASPPKSESSRDKLSKKVLDIDGEEVEVNDAFLNDSARIADELNLDELVSARLAFYAMGDAKRLGISIYESALTLYYVRRQYIIDIVRFGIECLPVDKLDLVMGPAEKRLDHVLDALKAIERGMDDLNDKAKTGEFMGLDKTPEFTQVLKMQREFLIKEHESLGNVLYAYFSLDAKSENRPESLLGLLRHLATFDTLDSRILSYFAPLVVWFSARHTEAFTNALWSYFSSAASASSQASASSWKLPYLQSGIALLAYVALSDEECVLPPSIEYSSIVDAARHAIDSGALEFWMSLTQDISTSLGDAYFDKFRPLVRSRVPRCTFWQPVPSQTTLENFQSVVEILFTGFIRNMADILREMRLSEEDMYLAMNESEEDTYTVSPGLDFERFLLFVAIACRDHPESAKLFFEDKGDALYGFLVWAADCQVTFMSTTFTELIASLANDEKSGAAIHEFLVKGIKQNNQNEDGFVLSWSSLYDVIEYYIRGVSLPSFSNAVQNGNTTHLEPQLATHFAVPGIVSTPSTSTRRNASFNESSLQVPVSTQHAANSMNTDRLNSVVRNSVMPRISGPTQQQAYNNTASPSSAATTAAGAGATFTVPGTPANGDASTMPQSTIQWGLPGSANVPSVSYSPSPQQSQLSDDTLLILSAYMSLIARVSSWCADARQLIRGRNSQQESTNKNDVRDIVPLLFKLLKLRQPITGAILNALIPFASTDMWPLLDSYVLNKFDEVLYSLQDALALTRLVEQLSTYDEIPSRLNVYTDFILNTILPWTTASSNTKEQDSSSRNILTLLQVSCLGFLKVLLSKAPHNEHAFKVCFAANVYKSIFEVLAIGIDRVNDLDVGHPLVQAVTVSVEVVHLLVKLSIPPSWSFDKPVLYHLEIVPHLALYAGSLHTSLSFSSISLLTLLDQSPEFRATINRQSRILSILSSTTESTRIRLGLLSRLEDDGTDICVKKALLEMIIQQLRSSGGPGHYMTVAHYLLGFNQSELGLELKLELESGAGGILSGSSLLSAICDCLLVCLMDIEKADCGLLRLCSEILLYLVTDGLTSEMVLDYLRQFDFWLNTIKYEPMDVDFEGVVNDFLEHRAAMLEIWIREILLCQKRLLLTVESHYLDSLVPMVFSLVNFTTYLPRYPTAFKCLKAWCKLIPVVIASGDPNTGSAFVSRIIRLLVTKLPEYSKQNADFAVPVASLLVFLFEKFQDRGVDDSVARHMHSLFEAALLSMQPAQVNGELRTFLYSICFHNLNLVLQSGSDQSQADTLRALSSSGPRIFNIACDDVLDYANEQLRIGALLFIQMSTILSGRLGSDLISRTLLRYNFIPIFIDQVLVPALLSVSESSPTNTLGASSYSGSKSSAGAADAESALEAGISSIFAGGANSTSGKSTYETKLRLGRISLSLLLPIAQTSAGAMDILSSGLLKCLDAELSRLPCELLLQVLQLLIAMIVSLGSENTIVLDSIRGLLDRHRSSVASVLRRDAAVNHTLQDQSSESEVVHLARNFTILMSLTGAV